MKKKLILLVVAFVSICFAVSIASAYAPTGDYKKGKAAFASNCAACHQQGGKAPALNPSKKPIKDWTACFNNIKTKHKGAINKVSEAVMTDIYSYFHYNAADGQAMKGCG